MYVIELAVFNQCAHLKILGLVTFSDLTLTLTWAKYETISLVSTFAWSLGVHMESFGRKILRFGAVTTRLWNKDFIRILKRTYKPILSACFPLKIVRLFNLIVLSFNRKKTTRFAVALAFVQKVQHKVQHIGTGSESARLYKTLRRIVAHNHSPPLLDADWIWAETQPHWVVYVSFERHTCMKCATYGYIVINCLYGGGHV